MNDIVDYDLIYGLGIKELKANIIAAMEEGWQPFGGVAVQHVPSPTTNVPSIFSLVQAVVKYKTNKDVSSEG